MLWRYLLSRFILLTSSLLYTDDVQIESNGMWTMEEFEYKTFHYERCRQLCLNDPVHTVELKKYVQSQVSIIISVLVILTVLILRFR